MATEAQKPLDRLRERLRAVGWQCDRRGAVHPVFGRHELLHAFVLARHSRAIEALSAAGLVHTRSEAAQC